MASECEYTVTTYTGDKWGAGTDANVLITIFGKNGDTGERQLDNAGNNFETSCVDAFEIKSSHLGKLKKIRIGHDNTGFGAAWYLDKVTVSDPVDSKLYEFPVYRWFPDESDGSLFTEIAVQDTEEDEEDKPAEYEYTVTTYTGNKWGAGTDANVLITIYGADGDSGERKLDNTGNTFENGSVDAFSVKTPYLGPMRKIRIGHDNTGLGAAWYLDKVTVNDPKADTLYEFPCYRWFPDENDGSLFCEISLPEPVKPAEPEPEPEPEPKPEPEPEETITTVETIEVETLPEIDVVKSPDENKNITVTTDEGGTTTTTEVIKTTEDNGTVITRTQIMKTIVIEGDDLTEEELAAGFEYIVNVHTGDKFGAGTDANVVITLIGENGQLGEMKLDNEGNNFEKGSVDTFTMWSSVHLGELQKIRIGHDNSGPGPAWFLDKVTVEDKKESKSFEFPCGRWFPDDDDNLTVREIENPDRKKEPEGRSEPGGETTTVTKISETTITTTKVIKTVVNGDIDLTEDELAVGSEYIVNVHTGDKFGAGTDANVVIALIGENGQLGEMKIDKQGNTFEKGSVDTFNLWSSRHLGELQKIRIGHDNTGAGPAWFLDKVTVEDKKDGKTYEFPCARWFPDDDDGLTVREIENPDRKKEAEPAEIVVKLDIKPIEPETPEEKPIKVEEVMEVKSVPEPDEPQPELEEKVIKLPKVIRPAGTTEPEEGSEYVLSTYTGDKWGAGTDANVLVTLFGEKGTSGEFKLDNEENNFESGGVDTFPLTSDNYLGELEKIRLGHDNSGMGPAWYVDKVTVLDTKTNELYEFPCNRWFPDEDDGSLSCEIELPKPKVEVEPAEVVVKLDIKPSEPETPEEKPVKVEEVMEVKSVPEPDEPQPELEEKVIKLPKVIRPAGTTEPEEGSDYVLSTYTGDKWGAGTDANVLVTLFGEKGTSGEFKLDNEENNFESGGVDTFPLTSDTYLGELQKIRIGHDNSGLGPAWYVDKVTVLDTKTNKLYEFPCNRWFPDEDDGSLSCEIELPKPKVEVEPAEIVVKLDIKPIEPETPEEKPVKVEEVMEVKSVPEPDEPQPELEEKVIKLPKVIRPAGTTEPEDGSEYVLSTYTGDKWGAGTDANVLVTLFGESGTSGEFKLDNEENNFESGGVDTFRLTSDTHLGELQKIRLGHDNSGLGPAWYVDKVTVLDTKTNELYEFPCNRWFPDEDDGSLSCEIELPKPKVEVEPGEIVVQLDIKPIEPEAPKKEPEKVEEVVEVKSVPEPDHPYAEFGEKVVKLPKIVRPAGTTEPEDGSVYVLSTYTGDKWGAGTDANVLVILFGEKGTSGEFKLDNEENNFESGGVDTFTLTSDNYLGELQKIRLGHDNSGMGPAWYVDKVIVVDSKTDKVYEFPCNRWFPDEDDGSLSCEIELPKPKVEIVTEPGKDKEPEVEKVVEIIEMESAPEPEPLPSWTLEPGSEPEKPPTIITTTRTVKIIRPSDPAEPVEGSDYTVSTFTGDKWGSGTDANVLITIFGENGDSGEFKLDNSGNNFESGQKDTFEIGCEPHLGDLCKIRIGHDNSGMGPAWYLDKVTVLDKKCGSLYEFPCNRWFPDEGDGSLNAEIELPKPKVEEGKKLEELEPQLDSSIRTVTTTRTVKIIRQGGPIGEAEGGCEYIVSTYTGDKFGAGTDANVLVSLFGENGQSGEFKLDNKGNNFEKGKKDTFKLANDVNLGDLNKIRIGHDNSGLGPAWYLKKVTVLDTKTGKLYEFPCKRWFPDNDDGSLSCEIELPKPEEGGVVIQTNEFDGDVIETSFKGETEITRVIKKETFVTRTITVTGPSGEPQTTEVIADPRKRKDSSSSSSSSSSISSSDSEIQEFAETPRTKTSSKTTVTTTVVKTTTTGPGGIQVVEEHAVPLRKEKPPIARPESWDLNESRKEDFPKPLTRPHSELILPPEQRTHKTEAYTLPLKGNVGVWVPHPDSALPPDMLGDPDYERLLDLEKEGPSQWTRVKKTKDAEVWKRKGDERTAIHKAYIDLEGIPYSEAVDLINNWNTRPKWDKTFAVVHVLDNVEEFKVLYMCINTPPFFRKREIVLATKEKEDRSEDDSPFHILAWRSTKHPSVGDPTMSQKKPSLIRVYTLLSGVIIRPIDDGAQSSKVVVITQLPVESYKQINHTYLAGNPIKWEHQLKKYHAEEHKPSEQQIEQEKERKHQEEERQKQERRDSKRKKKEDKEKEKKQKQESESKRDKDEKKEIAAEEAEKKEGEAKIEVTEDITVETKPDVEMAIGLEVTVEKEADEEKTKKELEEKEAKERHEKEEKAKKVKDKEEKAKKLKEEKERKKEEEKEKKKLKKRESERSKKEKKAKKERRQSEATKKAAKEIKDEKKEEKKEEKDEKEKEEEEKEDSEKHVAESKEEQAEEGEKEAEKQVETENEIKSEEPTAEEQT